jgi:hypothetical protein
LQGQREQRLDHLDAIRDDVQCCVARHNAQICTSRSGIPPKNEALHNPTQHIASVRVGTLCSELLQQRSHCIKLHQVLLDKISPSRLDSGWRFTTKKVDLYNPTAVQYQSEVVSTTPPGNRKKNFDPKNPYFESGFDRGCLGPLAQSEKLLE